MTLSVAPGEALPFGLHECCEGLNLAVFSRHATRMTLLLFDAPAQSAPAAVFDRGQQTRQNVRA